MKTTLVLVILDGWGIGKKEESNPIYAAQLETIPSIESRFPACALQASGIAVGLPWGEEGNSEVGHLTIGSGQVLYQHLPRISLAIQNGSFFSHPTLKKIFAHSRVHLVGLLSDGNVHASLEHLDALIEMAKRESCKNLFLHLFTDGRDSGPRSGIDLVQKLEKTLREKGVGTIASVAGRAFGMDRDRRWQQTAAAYQILTSATGPRAENAETALKTAYAQGVTDEFVPPTHTGKGAIIEDGDAVLFFNFREDRMRELTEPFWNADFKAFPTHSFADLFAATMTQYDERSSLPAVFPTESATEPLGKVLADNGKTQLRVAETEKYAHVTYFFNGMREKPFPGEYRVLIPSVKTAHYEEHPEMQARAITDRILLALSEGSFDVIVANYANPDMVAHTGNLDATIAAVRVIDNEVARLLKSVELGGHMMVITSDHGNAEVVLDPRTGEGETRHNTSPVPFYLVARQFQHATPARFGKSLPTIGILSDIAPTILELMHLPKPISMTGESILEELLLVNG